MHTLNIKPLTPLVLNFSLIIVFCICILNPDQGCEGTSAIALNPSNNRDVIVSTENNSLLIINSITSQIVNDPITVHCHVTSLSWQPSISQKYSSTEELLLVAGCSDGSLILFKPVNVGKNYSMVGKKKIVAHEGAVTAVEWSPDGSSLLSSGEDGEVKVWSQTGHLRSILARFNCAVNCVAWNSESSSIISAHDSMLSIHQVQNKGECVEWNVVEDDGTNGVIMAVDWNSQSNLVVCGGEDCKYRVFDSHGVTLFTSQSFTYPVTSVRWLSNGDAFVAGSFDTITLCSTGGEKMRCFDICVKSSIIDMKCTKDSSQVHALSSSGSVLVANVIGKVLEWNGVLVEQINTNQIRLDLTKEGTSETVQIQEGPIIHFRVACEHLIIITRIQCHIYPLMNLRSVVVFDVDRRFSLTSMSLNNFASVGSDGINVYSYSGRKISSIQYEGFIKENRRNNLMSISRDILALVDPSDSKTIRFFDSVKGKSLFDGATIHHEVEIQCIHLSHFNQNDNKGGNLAFLDKNRDLFIVSIQSNQSMNSSYPLHKIGTLVDSVLWNETSATLAYITESRIIVCYYPLAPFVDIDLLSDTKEIYELEGCEKGKIISFCGAQVCIGKPNGTILQMSLTEDPSPLFENAIARKWKESIRFCRFKDTTPVWATLACLALSYDKMEIAEITLMAIKRVDKVDRIKQICSIPEGEIKNAEIQLNKRNFEEAIAILLQSRPPFTYRAIKMLIQSYKWDRALDVAIKSEDEGFVDIVLWYKVKHLKQMENSETNARFRSLLQQKQIISDEQLSKLKSKMR